MSFSINRKDFDAAWKRSRVESLYSVFFLPPRLRSPSDFFSAIGVPEPPGVQQTGFLALASLVWRGVDHADRWAVAPPFTTTIRLYTVPSELRAELRERMVEEGLPLMFDLIRSVELGPETGRTITRRFGVYLDRGRVQHSEG